MEVRDLPPTHVSQTFHDILCEFPLSWSVHSPWPAPAVRYLEYLGKPTLSRHTQEARRRRPRTTNTAPETKRKRALHHMITHTHVALQRRVPHTTDPSMFHFISRLACMNHNIGPTKSWRRREKGEDGFSTHFSLFRTLHRVS